MLKKIIFNQSATRLFNTQIARFASETPAVQKKGEENLKLKDKSLEAIKDVPIVNAKHKNIVPGLTDEEIPIPVSPQLGPYRVSDLKISEKKYRWCACGQSLSQPFCDGSHKGSKFIPLRFTIEEKVDHIDLCGCKFTKSAPYCDGETCVNLKKGKTRQTFTTHLIGNESQRN